MDPQSLVTGTPRTVDGRTYPDRLRVYEVFDEEILPLLDGEHALTFDELSLRIDDPRALALLPRWISSARWRGLIDQDESAGHGPYRYVLSARGHEQLPHAA